jgi:uncharacterized membrane protein YhaH (DUF805 family)
MDWWLIGIGLSVLQGILSLVVIGIAFGPDVIGPDMDTHQGVAAVRLAFVLLAMWPILAVSVRRAHDRDKRGWLPFVYFTLNLVYYALMAAAPDLMAPSTSEDLSRGDLIAMVLGLPGLLIGVWLLITLGFLDGTKGPNRYGASPKGVNQKNYQSPRIT